MRFLLVLGTKGAPERRFYRLRSTWLNPSTRSSSAAARADTSPPSAPPSWAARPPWSSATSRAGAASTTPASRRRPSCARRRSTTTPATAPSSGVVAKDVELDWDSARQAPRRGLRVALGRREDALGQKQGDPDRGRGQADRRGQRPGRRRRPRGGRRRSSPPARPRCRSPGSSSATGCSTPGAPGRCPQRPAKIAVVGAGASGCEIASAYGRFGTEVLLIEMLDQILPAEDKDMARVVERAFKKQNIAISTGAPVENVEASGDSVKFTYGGESAEVDYLCVAGGRATDVEGLGLEAAGVELDRARQGRRSTSTAAPATPRSTRSATWSTPRRSPTRHRRRASSRPSMRPAPRPTRSTRTSSPARPSATRRSPASGSPRRRRRRPATTSRSAS